MLKSRLSLTILLPAGLVILAGIAFFVVLFGRYERRREIERAMSRVLSALFDGQGDVTYSAWSYYMVTRNKKYGPPRVRFVDWLNAEPGHCQAAYVWHAQHALFDQSELDTVD